MSNKQLITHNVTCSRRKKHFSVEEKLYKTTIKHNLSNWSIITRIINLLELRETKIKKINGRREDTKFKITITQVLTVKIFFRLFYNNISYQKLYNFFFVLSE